MDSIGLLNLIKKLAFTESTNNLHTRHNKAMSHIDLMNLHKDRFQNMQDFIVQSLPMKKECDVLILGKTTRKPPLTYYSTHVMTYQRN